MWFHIGRAMKDPRGVSIMTVQENCHKGSTAESTNQEEAESMRFKEAEYIFQLAMGAH